MKIYPNHPKISSAPEIFGGKPCINGTRVTVETVVHLAKTESEERILCHYPYLRKEDIHAALAFAKENKLVFGLL